MRRSLKRKRDDKVRETSLYVRCDEHLGKGEGGGRERVDGERRIAVEEERGV